MNELTQRSVLAFQAGHGAGVLALAAVALVVLVALGILSGRGMPRGRRVALGALRAAAALAIVLLALRPVIQRQSLAVTTLPVAVVVDASASMGVRDQGDVTRLQAVAEWARDHEALLDRLEEVAVLDWFAASDGVLRATSRREVVEGKLEAAGSTDLLASLRQLAERYPGGRRPPLLLFSDGADHGELGRRARAGQPIEDALPAGAPVVAFAPSGRSFADVALDVVAHDPVGFLRTPVTIRARVRSSGLPATEIPISLLRGDQVVSVKAVRVGGEAGPSAEVTFSVEAATVGESLYWLQVPLLSGEAVAGNNEVPLSVRVVRDRIRVLQVVGRPSWDGRFLRELLKRNPAIDLISFFILRNSYDDTNADVDELSLIPFPVDELFEEKLDGFDLVIFQNLNFAPYGMQPHLASLRRQVVERGGGLCVIGGDLALQLEYRDADLAEVLPVELAADVAWLDETATAATTPAGERHPILRLGGAAGAGGAVAELIPVRGLNVGLRPRGDAQVLLEDAATRRPLLVAGESGEGRVIVLATDGSWRWSLPMAGRGKSTRSYERFWQNALRWLVRDPGSALLLLDADRRGAGPGESVELRAQLRDEAYEPRQGDPVTLTVRDARGLPVREEAVPTGDDGVARLTFEPPAAGIYAVTASTPEGTVGPLFVERVDEGGELQDAAVDEALLRALAEATGGSLHALTERGVKLPFAEEREVRVEAVRVIPLWRTWPAWGVIAGLLCCEWWLRRRWGLA